MTEVKGKTFTKTSIPLDDHSYLGCTFTHCKMIYAGTTAVRLVNCRFLNCSWRFAGPAARALVFMRDLYAMGGDGATLVEATFENIRKRKPTTTRISVRTQYRSSKTGQWVSTRYSQAHPQTTEKERIEVPSPPPHKHK